MNKFSARDYNYTEPCIGVAGRPHCEDCIYTLEPDGRRCLGTLRGLDFTDADYGKLVMYCDKQKAYVKPYAWCDELEEQKAAKEE